MRTAGNRDAGVDRFAYSEGRCYGLKQADLRASGKRMPDPPATLQVREVEAIADFLAAKVVKQGPMDHPDQRAGDCDPGGAREPHQHLPAVVECAQRAPGRIKHIVSAGEQGGCSITRAPHR